ATAGGAVFPPIEDDLEVELVPGFPEKELFQVALRLDDVLSGSELPTGGQAMDVGIDGKCRYTEGLRHHDRRGLVANAREFLQIFKAGGNLSAVFFDQDPGQV